MKVAFRVDSSSEIGGGHLMRCVTLAESLADLSVEVFFICRDFPGNLIDVLKKKSIETYVLPKHNNSEILGELESWLKVKTRHDADETIAAIKDKKIDLLIIDHYGIDINWERQIRPYVNKIMVIDDLANRRHECDILLDQNFLPNMDARYKSLVPTGTMLMLGAQYALLKNEFKHFRVNSQPSGTLKNILVFFTTGDDKGQTIKALSALSMFDEKLKVDVVVGKKNEDIKLIERFCFRKKWQFHCQIDYMPRLIYESNLIIGAAGSSSWERCSLGVPAIIAVLAENQVHVADALSNSGVAINLGWHLNIDVQNYLDALNSITDEKLFLMSNKALAMVDAFGVDRVIEKILFRSKGG